MPAGARSPLTDNLSRFAFQQPYLCFDAGFLSPSPELIWLGGGLWGAAMGLQDATMRSGVATLTPESVRGTAYGIFDAAFGTAWLLGSLLLGWLYGVSPQALVIVAVMFQIAALPLLWLTLRGSPKQR